jgi:uncharacterized hydantoinase/oxoprolinase family protein
MACDCNKKYIDVALENLRSLATRLSCREKQTYVLVRCGNGNLDIMPETSFEDAEGYTAVEYFIPV